MALHLHRAERTDVLADGLGALLADPLPDPFAEELVLVPARGVERWLSQRLSHVLGSSHHGDGVCAGVSFRSPGSLIAEITGTLDDDPWAPDAMSAKSRARLRSSILRFGDEFTDAPRANSLAAHQCPRWTTSENGRRFGLRTGASGRP
jgi:exonuclease V gamma subunit